MKKMEIASGGEPGHEIGVDYYPSWKSPIVLWAGNRWQQNARFCSPEEALRDPYRDHIVGSGAAWFLPLIEKLRDGARITLRDIKKARADYQSGESS